MQACGVDLDESSVDFIDEWPKLGDGKICRARAAEAHRSAISKSPEIYFKLSSVSE
jgi:hypothetical protein